MGNEVDKTIVVEVSLNDQRNTRNAVFAWIWENACGIEIKPDCITDGTDTGIRSKWKIVGAIAFTDDCVRICSDNVGAIPVAAIRDVVENDVL